MRKAMVPIAWIDYLDDNLPMSQTLFDLESGDSAQVVRISCKTPECVRRRLLDMGFTKGAQFRVERHAPLGDPVQIVIKGYRLAVRLSEARQIEVDLIQKQERLTAVK